MATFVKDNLNSIAGTAGADLILVGDPADALVGTIDGGGGTDELRFTSTTGQTLVVAASTVDVERFVIGTGSGASADRSGTTSESVNAFALTANVEILGNAGSNGLTGGSGNDLLDGGAGNDTLNGGAGNDIMLGGAGNDIYYVDSAGDQVIESFPMQRVSVDGTGTQINGDSYSPALSPDGRYVLFESASSALVAGDTNGTTDIFMKDLLTGSVTRISTDSAGAQANSSSQNASFSADGRYVVFQSGASNLVVGDSNGATDIFLKDLLTGTVTRASTDSAGAQANNLSYNAAISADGRYVAFQSSANNLVAGDFNGTWDIFVKDLVTGTLTRASTDSAGAQANNLSYNAAISDDGRYVAFHSNASNLVAGDTNNQHDIFVKDLVTGAVTRASTLSAGGEADYNSQNAAISADGRYVVFESYADNLVAGDTNGYQDIFIKDLVTGAVSRVSTDSAGAQGNNYSLNAAISADGRYVAFESAASNLVAGDTNGRMDIFVKDLLTGAVSRLNVGDSGTQGNNHSYSPAISADGRYVAYDSTATNLVAGDTNNYRDVFVAPVPGMGGTDTVRSTIDYTLATGLENLELIGGNLNGTGNALANTLSGTGGDNQLDGGAGNDTLIGGAGNDTYVVDAAGDAVTEAAGEGTDSVLAGLTFTLAANVENLTLTGGGNIGGTGNAQANTLTGNAGANQLDGGAGADTMAGGTGDDTYVVDDAGDTITEAAGEGTDTVRSSINYTLGNNLENLVLTGSGNLDGTGNELNNILSGNSGNNLLSGGAGNDTLDGGAGNDTLDGGAGNDTMLGGAGNDIYYVDSAGDQVVESFPMQRVSTDSAGTQINSDSLNPALSPDGRYVIFESDSAALVAGDTNGATDLFLKDLLTGSVTRISTDSAGAQVNSSSFNAAFSADGRYVAFESYADNLVGMDSNGLKDIFVKDLATGAVTRASTDSAGAQANSGSANAALSADGRYVVFLSGANNLVAGDTNGYYDIFVKDLLTGTVTRASTDSAGSQSNGDSYNAALTADGRYVVFESVASNLVAGDTNGQTDIFVKDLLTGTVTRASTDGAGAQANNNSYQAAISADGRHVVFLSNASNLVVGDTNGFTDVYVKDLLTGTVTRASTNSAGAGANYYSGGAAISADGRYVTFASQGWNLVAGDLSSNSDIFVKDLLTGALMWVSADVIGTESNNHSGNAAISADGRYVAYDSTATNLVAGDTNNYRDIFVAPVPGMGGTDTVRSTIDYTLTAGVENLELTGGNLNGTGNALANTLSGTGGDNLLDGGAGNDTLIGGAGNDTYVVDAVGDAVTEAAGEGTDTVLASASHTLSANVENLTLTGSGGIGGTGNAQANTLTGNAGANRLDGGAGADTLIGGAGNDTYVVDDAGDLITENPGEGTDTVRSSIDWSLGSNLENLVLTGSGNLDGTGNGLDNVLSGNAGANQLDGGSGNDLMLGGAGNDIYYVDSAGDQVVETFPMQRASTDSAGAQANNDSQQAAISADGRYVAFTSYASNLVAGDTNGQTDIFVKDLATGAVTRASTDGAGAQANSTSSGAALSADGRYVVFLSAASNLVAGDTNGYWDIFVKDLFTGAVTRASTDGAGTQANGYCYNPAISADGRYVAFDSTASSLVAGDTNGTYDVFVKDLVTGAMTRVSTDSAGAQAYGNSQNAALSADGRYVVFESYANNLVAGDTNNTWDVFVKDLVTGVVTRASTDSTGAQASNQSLNAAISADGRYVAFESNAGNLVAGDTNNQTDIFVKDLVTGAITRVSTDGAGAQANSSSQGAALSADGRYVAFQSAASNLVAGDTNGAYDIFVKDLLTGAVSRLSVSGAGAQGNNGSELAAISADGHYVAYHSYTSNLVAGDTNAYLDVFVAQAYETPDTDTVRSTIDYTLATGLENLELIGGNLNGTGNAAGNTLTGTGGDNQLDGGAGADTMIGGAGNDTYVVDNAGDTVVENAGEGTDAVLAGLTFALSANVENLTLTGSGDSGGTGNALANVLTGNGGHNQLDGGAGADTLAGGAGNDTYVVDNAGDTVVENAGEGTDLVLASVTFTLSANVENLTLTGGGDIGGTGNALNNLMTGNGGSNLLAGGAGDDTYVVGEAGDAVVENAAEGTDTVQSSISRVLGANLENLVLTGSGNLDGTGNALANALTGNGGHNQLDGAAGADTLAGGAGNDSYVVDDAGDVVVENPGEGTDTIQSSVSYANAMGVEYLILTGSAHLNGTGTSIGETHTGNNGNNILDGLGGNDVLNGNAGNDTLNGGDGDDAINGGAGADRLNGGAGNDALDGGAGYDIMAGGAGNDTYTLDSTRDAVRESTGEGIDTVITPYSFSLAWTEIENVTLTGVLNSRVLGNTYDNAINGNAGANRIDGGLGNDTLNGGAGNDALIGGKGSDTLDGGAGNDSMSGGLGDDTYFVDSATDIVAETDATALGGIDTVNSSVSWSLGANLENLVLAGAGNINGTGNALDNAITGNAGNNVLNGGVGADTLVGGAGNDSYFVDTVEDSVTELAGGGSDTLVIAYNNADPDPMAIGLPGHFENITIAGTGLFDLLGSEAANVLAGNGSANALFGFEDNDQLIGGAGNDYLDGGDGNDLLDGGTGNDVMVGGIGDDRYVLDVATDGITEYADEGNDTIVAAFIVTLLDVRWDNIENAVLAGTATNITGDVFDNRLEGNASANTLDGGAGADTLVGGLGGDTYIVDNAGDVVTETSALATEIDTVKASISYSLGANLENLTLTGTLDIDGTGNALANILTGNDFANVLDGGAGADTLKGGKGNDTYLVDLKTVGTGVAATAALQDTVTENLNEGSDTLVLRGTATLVNATTLTLGANLENLDASGTGATMLNLTGNAAANTMTGNDAANVLNGGLGNDTLFGGAGNDKLMTGGGTDAFTGGAGNDTFVLERVTGLVAAIADFTSGEDKLGLGQAAYGTLFTAGVLKTEVFDNGTAANTSTQRLFYNAGTGGLWYDSDGSGAAAAVQVATLTNQPGSLAASDFVLVAGS